jgi:hypothetical protein
MWHGPFRLALAERPTTVDHNRYERGKTKSRKKYVLGPSLVTQRTHMILLAEQRVLVSFFLQSLASSSSTPLRPDAGFDRDNESARTKSRGLAKREAAGRR